MGLSFHRSLFSKDSLFYLPKTYGSSYPWLNATEAAGKLSQLETEYPSCSVLLRCLLKSGQDGLDGLVTKLSFTTVSTPLADTLQILKDLNAAVRNVSKKKANAAFAPILDRRFMPTTTSTIDGSFDLLSACSNATFYIADRDHLAESFHGRVPLLAFRSEEISMFRDVIPFLKLDDKLLSTPALVESQTDPQGRFNVHGGYTKYLKHRSVFFQA